MASQTIGPPPIPLTSNTPSKSRRAVAGTDRRARTPSRAVRHTISGAHGALAVSGIAHIAGVPTAFAAALGAVLLVAGVTWANPRGELGFGLAAGAVAGGWMTWSAYTTPFSVISLASLVVAAVGIGMWYSHVLARAPSAAVQQQISEAVSAATAATADTERSRTGWQQVLTEAECDGVTVTSTRDLGNGASGFRVAGDFTSARFGYAEMSSRLPVIERIADRYTDYPIRAGSVQLSRPRGSTASKFELSIPTADIFGAPIPHPLSHEPRSIEDPIEIATAADGRRLSVTHRDSAHGMFSGMTDYGKSNFLNVHIYEWTRSIDAASWLICGPDKAAKLFKPLFRPWLKGEVPNPPIDRFAACWDESMYLLWDAICGMKARSTSGGIDDTGSKWKVTPDTPRLVIGIEEAGDFLEDDTKMKMPDGKKYSFGELLRWLIRKARSEGINLIILTQGGTLDFLGADGSGIKKQVVYRVAFHAQTTSETNAVLAGDTRSVDLGSLGKGEIYIEQSGDERPVLALADYIEEGSSPDEHMMDRAARHHYSYVRGLDAHTAAAMPFYADRWTRADQQEFLGSLAGMSVNTITATAEAPVDGVGEVAEECQDGDGFNASEHATRMQAIVDRLADEVQQGEQQQEIAELERSLASTPRSLGDLNADTLRIVGVLHQVADDEVAADDLRAQVAGALDQDDSTEIDRRINSAVRDVLDVDEVPSSVKRRRTRNGSKVSVWDMAAIRRSIDGLGRVQ